MRGCAGYAAQFLFLIGFNEIQRDRNVHIVHTVQIMDASEVLDETNLLN